MDEIDFENPSYIPTAGEYAAFLESNKITILERDILLVQWSAPNHCARNAVIAQALGQTLLVVNGSFGRLGSKIITEFGTQLPPRAQVSHALSWFEYHEDGFYYSTMHKPLAKAVQSLRWGDEATRRFGQFWVDFQFKNPEYWEGRQREATAIQRARNGQARQMCIDHYGRACFVCRFDFENAYGAIGSGFIEVHHLEPVSARCDGRYAIDPVKDLRLVCSNCHRILHRGAEIDIDDFKSLVQHRRL